MKTRVCLIYLFHDCLLGKHSNHFKNIKTSLKKDPFDISSVNDILYFTSKCLKQTLEENNMKSGTSSMVLVFLKHGQYVQYFASTHFKRSLKKSHMKLGP